MASLFLLAIGCDKEQNGTVYSPNSDDAKEIHFIQSSLTKEFPQGTKTGTIEIELARPSDKGELSVGLQKKGENEDSFTVPETVTIPNGSYSVKIPVEVNLGRLLAGSSLNATILISDRQEETGNGAYVTQFSDKINLSVSYALEWKTYYRTDESGAKVPQTATYHYNAFYTGQDSGLEVEKAVGANIFRVNDWASGVSFKFILNDDNSCTVPAQSIGYYNSNYNEYVKVADMAEYTGNKAAYSSYPCTYDGKGTFSFYLIYYVSAGYFAQGAETLTFDGNEDKTPAVEITFDGIETTETGFKAPRLSFHKNEYAKFYKATVVRGDITGDSARQEEIKKLISEDKTPGSVPVLTLYDDSSELWNVGSGNCTAVALAYDSTSTASVLYMQRFTCDPDGKYLPKVNKFEWRRDESNPLYSPYTTLFWDMQADNAASLKYLCMRTDYLEYMELRSLGKGATKSTRSSFRNWALMKASPQSSTPSSKVRPTPCASALSMSLETRPLYRRQPQQKVTRPRTSIRARLWRISSELSRPRPRLTVHPHPLKNHSAWTSTALAATMSQSVACPTPVTSLLT